MAEDAWPHGVSTPVEWVPTDGKQSTGAAPHADATAAHAPANDTPPDGSMRPSALSVSSVASARYGDPWWRPGKERPALPARHRRPSPVHVGSEATGAGELQSLAGERLAESHATSQSAQVISQTSTAVHPQRVMTHGERADLVADGALRVSAAWYEDPLATQHEINQDARPANDEAAPNGQVHQDSAHAARPQRAGDEAPGSATVRPYLPFMFAAAFDDTADFAVNRRAPATGPFVRPGTKPSIEIEQANGTGRGAADRDGEVPLAGSQTRTLNGAGASEGSTHLVSATEAAVDSLDEPFATHVAARDERSVATDVLEHSAPLADSVAAEVAKDSERVSTSTRSTAEHMPLADVEAVKDTAPEYDAVAGPEVAGTNDVLTGSSAEVVSRTDVAAESSPSTPDGSRSPFELALERLASLGAQNGIVSEPSPVHVPDAEEEGADTLRWRAEMLMDEMLLGAVDSSAGEGERARFTAFDVAEEQVVALDPQQRTVDEGTSRVPGAGATHSAGQPAFTPSVESVYSANGGDPFQDGVETSLAGARGNGFQEQRSAYANGALQGNVSEVVGSASESWPQPHLNGHAPEHGIDLDGAPQAERGPMVSAERESSVAVSPTRPVASRMPTRLATPSTHRNGATSNGTTGAAQHDDQRAEWPESASQPAMLSAPKAAPRVVEATPRSAQPISGANAASSAADATRATSRAYPADPYAEMAMSDPPKAQRVVPAEQRYARAPRPIEGSGAVASSSSAGRHSDNAHLQPGEPFDPSGYESGLGPIRRSSAVVNGQSVTGAMSVDLRNSKYATLLPRNAPWDVHELEREFAALSAEMARVLPSGHESSRRARHLLEKAQSIFATDPLRTAEVDYYVAQVRSILQRSRQTMVWSDLYRRRVVLYLGAWAALAFVFVAVAFYTAPSVAPWLESLFGWSQDGFLARHAAPWLFAAGAGALGGALGGLTTLNRFQRRQLGFMDRKYSLRGLILPLMGLLAGSVLYALAGALLWATGNSIAVSPWVVLAVGTIAFVLGFVQEMVYGTRE